MPYAYVSLLQAQSDLGNRLYDPGSVFWTNVEKTAYLTEALRTWNAYTGFSRAEFILQLIPGAIWYDLADLATAPLTNRAFTVTDVDLYKLIQYHFLEPATGATWTGSLQFNTDDLLQAVQRRRDELLSGSGCTITRALVAANVGRTFLSDSLLDIRRIAWLPTGPTADYTNVPLWKDDVWSLQSYERDFTVQEPGTPSTYRQSTEPPLSFDVDIPPAVPGLYEVLSVNAGAALNPVEPTTLNIPDDFTWVVKFGAMGDLLNRDSNAKDPTRAAYCNLRYKQGMMLLYSSSSVLYARLNNLPLDIDAVQNADDFRPNWQGETAAQPDLALTAGLNLFGFSPVPDAGPYAATLMTVQNMPVPPTVNDFLQIGRDDYDVILDYAVHLASFKTGGAEFLSTMPLFKRFMTQAALYNSKLAELSEYTDAIYQLSQLQLESNPTFATLNPHAEEEG